MALTLDFLFVQAMCERMITAGADVMMKPETAEKANQCRDALSKALYRSLLRVYEFSFSRSLWPVY
jgi:myosin heavy subunit